MRNSLGALIALTCVVLLVLMIPLPIHGRVMSSASDLLHAPLFALFSAYVVGFACNRISRLAITTKLICWALVVGFGCITELLQPLFGRHASWQDMWANMCGASAGILWVHARTMPTKCLRFVAAIAGFLAIICAMIKPVLTLTDAAIQRLEMPRIASFERFGELSRWNWEACRVERVRKFATHGDWSLRVDFETGSYPGIFLDHPVPDWSRYETLVMDVYLASGSPLELTLRIEDIYVNHEHPDDFQQTVRLSPGLNRLTVALSDVAEGEIDLHRIWFLHLSTDAQTSPTTLYLDNFCLQ